LNVWFVGLKNEIVNNEIELSKRKRMLVNNGMKFSINHWMEKMQKLMKGNKGKVEKEEEVRLL